MSFNLGSAHGEIVIDYNGAGVQQAMGDLNSLSQQGTNLLRAGAGVTAFGAAIGGALLGATNQAADFQFQMDAVNAALGGLDASGMEAVTQQALDLGEATKFSAGEVAGVQEQLAKSGLSEEQILGGATQAVLDLSSATGESLQPATVATAAALNLFGISAEDTAKVADILTAGLNASSATLPDFQRGINSLGPVMANLNQYANDGAGAFRDTAAAVAYFNANGLKAADAGVSLARGLTNLATPTSKATTLMDTLGIAAFDAQHNFIGFPELFDQLQEKMSGMSDAERENALATIFGAEAADVMNQAVKKGGDGLRDYQAQLESNGQAAKQAAIRQDNLRGALENLSGSVQTAAIAFATPFLGPLQEAAKAITNLVNIFTELPPEVQTAIAAFTALAAALTLVTGGAITVAGAILRFGPAFAAAAAAAAPFLAAMLAVGAAIGLGILAYKTDFLGFGTAVNKAFGTAQKAIKNFSAGFNAALFRGQEAGLNTLANAVQAFGDALLFATGIDITSWTDRLASGIQAFGDAIQENAVNGVPALVSGLDALGAAADALGFAEVGTQLQDAARAAQQFGDTFARVSEINRQAGFSDLAAGIGAAGIAIDELLGTDLAPFFDAAAKAVQVFGTSFETARADGLDPFTSSAIALRDALTQLTGINLAPAFDQLGESIQSAIEGVQTFIQALQAGDIAGAMDQIGTAFRAALSGLGDQLSQLASTIGSTLAGLVVNLTDWVLNVAAPTLAGWITTAAEWIGEQIRTAVGPGGALAELSNWILTVAAPTLAGWTNAAAGWLSTTLGGIVSGLSGISVIFDNWVLTIDPPGGDAITVDASGIASAIGTALNGALNSIDPGTLLDIASFSSKIGAAFHDAFAAVTDAVVAAAQAAFSGDASWIPAVGDAVATAMTAMGAAVLAAIGGFAAGFVVGDEVDFHALGDSIRERITTALSDIAGTLGDLQGSLQAVSDAIAQAVQAAVDDAVAQIGGIDFMAIPKAIASGIGNALGQVGAFIFGVQDAEAASGDTFDAAAFGTQFGDQLAASFESPEFIDAVTASVDAMPAETFSAIGTGILTKISDAINTSLQTPATDELTGAPGAGGAMAAQIVTGLATAMQTAIDSAPIETFAAIGTSLVTKIQGAISAAMTTATAGGGGAPVGEGAVGGLGASLAQSLATSIAASITAAPIEAFAAIGTALQTKISEVLATAMQAGGGQATPQAGLGGTGGGGGIGQAIAQSIADAISGADFAAVATALQTNLGTAVTTAIQQVSTVISTATNVWITTFVTTFAAIAQSTLSGMAQVVISVQTGLESISQNISAYTNVWITTITTTVAAMQASLDGFAASAAAAGQAAGQGFADGMSAGMAAAQAAAQAAVDAIIGVLNSAADGAYAAGQAVGEGFASGMEASLGRVQAAAAAMADAAAEGLAAAAQIASPSKVAMALGDQFGQGFQLGIAGAAPAAAKSSYDMGFESIHALADSLRSNADARVTRLHGLADNIRENQGMATGGGQPMTIETTGTVEMDGEQMGTFVVETSMGGLVGAMRKGGRRRGRMQ